MRCSIEPMACHRFSPSTILSIKVMQKGSSKTSCAVSKSIRCLVLLVAFFCRSHSNRICIYVIVNTVLCQFSYLTSRDLPPQLIGEVQQDGKVVIGLGLF